jgi:quinol monooxygenase YgiN
MPIFIAKQGRASSLESALLTLQTASRTDEGCVAYSIFADLNDANRFILYEEWATQELLDDHGLQTHVVDFLVETEELLAEPFAVTRMRAIGGEVKL